jgi:hypothetical protein
MKKTKKMNNFSMALNPMNQMMMGGMPGLPDIFRDAFPKNIPPLPHNVGFIGRKLYKGKVRDLVAIKELEAAGAEADFGKFQSNAGKITEAVMFGPKIINMHEELEHGKTMRALEQREKIADIFIKEAQAQMMGYEAKSAEVDYNIRQRQYKKMEEDTTDI